MSEFTLNTYLAFIGLFMAAVEIYIPKLSLLTENSLDLIGEKLTPIYTNMDATRQAMKTRIESWKYISRYKNKIEPTVALLIFMSIVAVGLEEKISWLPEYSLSALIGIPALIGTILIFPVAIFLYFALPLFALLMLLIIIPLYVLEKSIHYLNIIGRGKAVSGIGLILAFQGLLTA